ncbi:hypothetical protein AB4Z09_25540 [Rhodococcus sp. TAF43]|uniref:hypothetical protein n=1 Tax=Rhodococcus sp. TAF43 TaxID=3237483 RepID=UPI003F9A46DC
MSDAVFRIFDLPRVEDIPSELIAVEEVRDVPGGVSISWSRLGATFQLVADPVLRSVSIKLDQEGKCIRIYREGAISLQVREEGCNIGMVIEFSSGSQVGDIRVVLGDRVEIGESALFA